MSRRSIEADGLTHATPIPSASMVGPFLTTSVIPPYDPGTRDAPDSLDAQIANLFTHMGAILQAADASWEQIAKVTFYVEDPAETKAALEGPWVTHFPDPASRPARHNLTVPPGPTAARIRCTFEAYVG